MHKSVDYYSVSTRCAATLWLPDNVQPDSTTAGIVMCHGFRGIKEWFLPDTAETLRRAGFVVMTIDYRGFGESDGVRGRLVPHDQVEDIRNAFTFLAAQPEVDEKRVGLWGTSFGGANVIQAAGIDERVRAVLAQVGLGNVHRAWWRPMAPQRRAELKRRLDDDRVKRVMTGRFGDGIDPGEILANPQSAEAFQEALVTFPTLATSFPFEAIERIFEFKPEEVVHKISPRPLLLIGASEDLAVPPEETEILFEKAGEPKRLEMMPITHYQIYRSPHRERADALAIEFFSEHLNHTSLAKFVPPAVADAL